MAGIPFLPRTVLHLLNAFIAITILLILFFPSLGGARSVYRPAEDALSVITDAFTDNTASPSLLVQIQQPADKDVYDPPSPMALPSVDLPPRTTALNSIMSTLRITWRGVIFIGHFLWFILFPIQVITVFLFNKLLFLFQPFIVMGIGVYTFFIVWPLQLVNYLAKAFYPLYIFLACASIVGLLVGGIASITSSYLNDLIFPPRLSEQPKEARPKKSESLPESVISSGAVTPVPLFRAPPPSKLPSSSGPHEDIHILDTNALFSSFSLPIPPSTPPGILYSAPTPAGSISGVVGETIFEEDDDSDEKTPVASAHTWGVGGGRPLTRPESAHGRLIGRSEGVSVTGTWHPRVKREDVDTQGIDWGSDDVRKRKTGVAV